MCLRARLRASASLYVAVREGAALRNWVEVEVERQVHYSFTEVGRRRLRSVATVGLGAGCVGAEVGHAPRGGRCTGYSGVAAAGPHARPPSPNSFYNIEISKSIFHFHFFGNEYIRTLFTHTRAPRGSRRRFGGYPQNLGGDDCNREKKGDIWSPYRVCSPAVSRESHRRQSRDVARLSCRRIIDRTSGHVSTQSCLTAALSCVRSKICS